MADDVTKRNPASKLLEILDRAKACPSNKETRETWCLVFGIPKPESDKALFKVLEHLVALRQLFNETVGLLYQIPEVDEELFIEPVERLARVVDLNNLHVGWANYSRYIQSTDMHSLRFCENLLLRHSEGQENEIPDVELQGILNELNSLYESVMASSLPAELKQSILELIQEMRQAIHLYRVKGAQALREVLTKSIGIVAANKVAFDENKDSNDVQSLMNMLIRIDKLYSFAIKMKPLLEAAANIFPALAGHIK